MNTTNKLTEGPILKNFLWFIIPIIITGFLQQFYNAADTMIVGKFDGGTALAAVGSTSSLINLIITFFNGLSIGTNVLCAKLFGAGDNITHPVLTVAVHRDNTLAVTVIKIP